MRWLSVLASLLAPDGLLILDPTEHLGKAGHLFTPDADGVYSAPAVIVPATPRHVGVR